MSLLPGVRLGPYEIVAPLGTGGMGEVYRARDTKLDRDVAIKILPAIFADDPERLVRFEREAKTLASLNHPHIAQVHGFEEAPARAEHHDRIHALVMELVEGPTLAERTAQGAMPVAEALDVARQIADALEAAHERGVIHRDLKPANIKVREDGTVKVLDFGLAKALDQAGGSSVDPMQSPTLTARATQPGIILGTAAYMAPEQAKGKPVDRRADIWAFGCVLYEMLTGRRAFAGDDVSDTLAFVITKEPDWAALPPATPAPIRKLLRRCLEKDRKRRLADVADARLEIEDAWTSAVPEPGVVTGPAVQRSGWRAPLLVAVTAVLFSVIGALVARTFTPATPRPITRFSIVLPPGQQFRTVGRVLALSPDGSQLVYAISQGVYRRSMSSLEATLIPGTEGAVGALDPVFSPDGQSIAFWSARDLSIKRMAASGGAAVTVSEVGGRIAFSSTGPVAAGPYSGMSWGTDAILLGQAGAGIVRVSPSGGPLELLVRVQQDEVAFAPQMLPDGRAVLFSLVTGVDAGRTGKRRIVVHSLKSGERKTLIEDGSDPRYLPTGHIVYAAGGVLFAAPFDLRRLEITGTPAPVVEGVRQWTGRVISMMSLSVFSISNSGTLVYVSGPPSGGTDVDLALIDRKGVVEPLKLPPGFYEAPRVSPDGTRVTFGSDDGKEAIIWIYDLSGRSSMRRLTFGGRNRFPAWSGDGQRVAFQSDREGDAAIFWQRADGMDTAERLTKPEPGTSHVPESWSPKGDRLLFTVTKGSSVELWTLSLPDKTTAPFGGVRSSTPTGAVFSPDGRWVAYAIVEPGRPFSAVYVQPFPATGATYQISKDDDGHHPVWSRDGKELFYVPGPGRMSVVGVTTEPSFAFTSPAPTAPAGIQGPPLTRRNADILPDGTRFIGPVAPGEGQSGTRGAEIHVVLNWFEELKTRVPPR